MPPSPLPGRFGRFLRVGGSGALINKLNIYNSNHSPIV